MALPDETRSGVATDQRREATIDVLSAHFAEDRLTLEEFERRIDEVHRARSARELAALIEDLPRARPEGSTESAGPHPARRRGSSHELADVSRVEERGLVLSVLGGTTRRGRWGPARRNVVLAVLGGAELDFREALMPPGVTEVHVYAFCGGVEILVPPNLHVESRGIAVLGGFDHAAEDSAPPGADTPTLRITGVSALGGVDIAVRHPGESARDARRRRRLARKEERRRQRGD